MSRFSADDDEESVTVAIAAYRLGCNQATVRSMLRCGELTGHLVGKGAKPRGIRVSASSIHDYKRRHAVAARGTRARAVDDDRYRNILERLRDLDLLPYEPLEDWSAIARERGRKLDAGIDPDTDLPRGKRQKRSPRREASAENREAMAYLRANGSKI